MPKKQSAVKLPPDQRHELEMFVTRGKKSAREITRARVLLLAQDGRRATDIARTLGVSRGTIYSVWKKCKAKGRPPRGEALQEAPRSGRPLTLESRVAAKVTMIAGSEPPAGRARWTLHLMAGKLVALGVRGSTSRESVRQLLTKTASSPGSGNRGASGKLRVTTSGIWETSCSNTTSRMILGTPRSVVMNGRAC
jgi:putative transposase